VQLPGFGLRITPQPHDHRTYFCMCMVGAGEIVRDDDGNIVAGRRLRRFTIGNARVVPLDQARQRAREILRRAEAGEDPTQPQATQPTFRDFAADYLRRRKGSLRAATYTELARIFREISILWGNRTLGGIRREDAVAWLDDKADSAPFAANRGLCAMRMLFGDAERRGLIEESPVARLKPPAKEVSRERSLGDDEIAVLWEAAGRLGHRFGGFYRLLLLTGQRRGQAAGMTWDEVDPEHALWTTPGSRMKTGKEHAVHLSELALDVLAEARAGQRLRIRILDRWRSSVAELRQGQGAAGPVDGRNIRQAASGMARARPQADDDAWAGGHGNTAPCRRQDPGAHVRGDIGHGGNLQ
jgi:integrase